MFIHTSLSSALMQLNGVDIPKKQFTTRAIPNSGSYTYYYNFVEVKVGDVVKYYGNAYSDVKAFLIEME